MGINRPSLYAAYGDKQALFRKVLDRYAELYRLVDLAMRAWPDDTGGEVVKRLTTTGGKKRS
jgi:AcrR family transcriptional regulator